MAKMHVNKSVEINASADAVYQKISDFHNWRPWSPWLIMDPEATVDVDEDGKAYSWKGERVGSGEMSVTHEDAPNKIDMDLTFLTPWKSHAKVWFTLSESNGVTKVNWFMDSSLPFFMFWMKGTMTALIGMDYDRGLNMLKDFVETGSVPCSLETDSRMEYPGAKYVGITRECSMKDIGTEMEKDFTALHNWIKENNIEITGEPFSQYHKWDLKRGTTQYTAGYPVNNGSSDLPENFKSGEIPATPVYSIKHTGPYRHLGNAWSLGQNLMRSKVFKGSKSIHPFESYGNDPAETPENELVTRINFPLR